MTRRTAQTPTDDVELAIPLQTVCFIIMRAREYSAKDVVTEPDPGSNPSDDGNAAVLEDHDNDAVEEELRSLIANLSIDEQIDLVALMWLGRDDHVAEDWETVRKDAAEAHNEHTADYLFGTPLLADYLAEGLSILDYSCADYEADRL
ncbi:DUF3775 domain-containing protein [Phyllobacterium salinisoli]|uniref:DUF3775 domain-containing protein n=1 Tax=Phyllobacterium salinisoli TaxID=1899321 RepID=A0A368JYP9_9HYPH|nr:DUF3775 domain-containing protein [Phyllobacterium salinisoli]RCS22257.1 DUF3775 domain-containing protein [Phyllobacterium salinisoli]